MKKPVNVFLVRLLPIVALFLATSCNKSKTADAISEKEKPDAVKSDSILKTTAQIIDTADYNKRMLALSNGDTTGKWPVKAPYPLPGAILPYNRIIAFYGNLYSKRMGILGELPKDEMLKKLFAAPPDKFPTIFETFVKSAESKNILFYFHEDKPRKLVEELNYAGRIKNTDGDYLHVNNANFAGLKGNLYIKSAIDQDIVIAADGSVTKKVKVTLRNTEKADGWLNSVYQNWMRLYVPKGSKLIKKEVYADFAEKEELGKTVWESFSRTLPLNFSETTLTYTLPFKVKKGQIYKLLIQKQGGTTDPHVITKINGRKLFEFDLKKDTTLEFKV